MAQQKTTNLNNADVESLAALPGVTAELAQSIVTRREEKPFETVDDVKSVEGVSDEVFNQIQALVTVTDNEAAGDEEDDETGEEQADETPVETTEEEAVEESTNGEAADEPVDDAEVDEVPVPEEASDDEAVSTDTPALVDNADVAEDSASEESGDYVINWPGETEEVKEEELAEVVEETAPQPAADIIDTPEEEPQPEPTPQPVPTNATGASEGFRRPWLLMLVGTLLGAFVALGALYIINDGVLVFANHPKIVQMETALATLEEREATLNGKIEGLQKELTQLSSMKEQVETNLGDIKLIKQTDETQENQLTVLKDLSTRLEDRASTLENRVSAVGKDVTSLQVTANKLTDALEEVEKDTVRFDAFLDGMRQLLIEAQE